MDILAQLGQLKIELGEKGLLYSCKIILGSEIVVQ